MSTVAIPHHMQDRDMDAVMNARTQRIEFDPHHDEVVRHGERLNVVERELAAFRSAATDIAEIKTQVRIIMWLIGATAVSTIGGLVAKFFDIV